MVLSPKGNKPSWLMNLLSVLFFSPRPDGLLKYAAALFFEQKISNISRIAKKPLSVSNMQQIYEM